jgi:predicted TIM-barrel enzyme
MILDGSAHLLELLEVQWPIIQALERVRALRDAGIILLASVTNPTEAQAVAEAGIHAVVAQGYEASATGACSIQMRRIVVSGR